MVEGVVGSADCEVKSGELADGLAFALCGDTTDIEGPLAVFGRGRVFSRCAPIFSDSRIASVVFGSDTYSGGYVGRCRNASRRIFLAGRARRVGGAHGNVVPHLGPGSSFGHMDSCASAWTGWCDVMSTGLVS